MKIVELRLKQKAAKGHEKDYLVSNGLLATNVIRGGGYKKLYKKAQELSKHIGETIVTNGDSEYWFLTTESVDYGLAAVCLETFIVNEDCYYVESKYFVDGEHVDTRIESGIAYVEERKKKKEFGTLKKVLRKLQVLQSKSHVRSFDIVYENEAEESLIVCIFKNGYENYLNVGFYKWQTVDDYIESYNNIVDFLK